MSYLYITAQDFGPWKPNEILVSVLQGGRVYIVTSQAKTVVPSIAACDAIWKAAEKKSADAKNFDDVRKQGDADFHRCFAERAKTMPFFAKLTAEAQTLLETLPLK